MTRAVWVSSNLARARLLSLIGQGWTATALADAGPVRAEALSQLRRGLRPYIPVAQADAIGALFDALDGALPRYRRGARQTAEIRRRARDADLIRDIRGAYRWGASPADLASEHGLTEAQVWIALGRGVAARPTPGEVTRCA